MFDLSPEKIMALLAVGLVVLGPQRLPTAARSLAHGMAKARQLAASLTDPVQTRLAEPRQHLESAVAELRGTVEDPFHAFGAGRSGAHGTQLAAPEVRPSPSGPASAAITGFDPTEN